MKKTLTVNLSGTVFNIDEDAYQLLDKYLSNLRIHFHNEDESEEIMNDFEMRISELLSEKIRLGYNVITIKEVEEVITRMGKPEEIFADGKEESILDNEPSGQSEEEQKNKYNSEFFTQEPTVTKKRLFRNPDDKVIGGVASGFAAYTGWDTTAIRVALLLLIFLTNIVIIPVYLILWIIIPLAKTASQKLQMRGESITLENIGKTVTHSFEKVSSGVNNYVKSEKPRNFLQKLLDVLVQIVGFILKAGFIVLAVLIGPLLLLILFVLVAVIFAMIFGGMGLLYQMMPSIHWEQLAFYPQYPIIFGSIGCILTIGIPLGTLIYIILNHFNKYKPVPTGVKWLLIILWIIGVITCIGCGTYIGLPFINDGYFHYN